MKNKIKSKDIIIFIILSIITCIIYQGYITNHYATDTYNIMNKGFIAYSISNSFIDGRIIMGALDLFVDWVNMPMNVVVISSTFIGILLSCIAVIILKNMMLDMKKTKNKFIEIIAIIISYITIFNFIYVENLYFIEAIVMGLSILMYILAVREIIRKNKFYYIKSLIFSIIATFAYQGTIGMLMICGFVFIIVKNKDNIKQIIKDLAILISIISISYIINVIQINIVTNLLNVQQERLNGIDYLLKCARNVFDTFEHKVFYVIMYNSCGLFPQALMLIFIIATLIIVSINEIKNREEKLLTETLQIIVLAILITVEMCIISLGSYDTGRIHNVIGALIGIMFIYIFCNSDIFVRNDVVKIILTMILVIYTITIASNTVNLISQHKTVNNLEKEFCEGLEKYIRKYEKENNILVTEAKYFRKSEKNKFGYFNSVANKSVLTYNGVACHWSSVGTINFYTNRNFRDETLNTLENKEIFEKYSKVKEEGYDNNFVIIDGVLYYSTFI